jgi:hypothetical protein
MNCQTTIHDFPRRTSYDDDQSSCDPWGEDPYFDLIRSISENGGLMKKISDDLQMLTDHIANTEEKLMIAEQESKERVEASIRKSQADARARREAFMFRMKEEQAAAAMQWDELQGHYYQKLQQIKNKIETEKEASEAKKAKQRAKDCEAYFDAAICFAMLVIEEVEVAALEAIDAEAYANSVTELEES